MKIPELGWVQVFDKTVDCCFSKQRNKQNEYSFAKFFPCFAFFLENISQNSKNQTFREWRSCG
jgi:hypothetical protein